MTAFRDATSAVGSREQPGLSRRSRGPTFLGVVKKPGHEDPRPAGALDSADPPRNFTLSIEERTRALVIGVPAYALRKRKIEDAEARFVRELVELRDKLRDKDVGRALAPADVSQALLAHAETFDLGPVNKLIATHNRYYPIEANLPIDPATGGYLLYGRLWAPEAPWTAARLVARAERDERAATSAEAR